MIGDDGELFVPAKAVTWFQFLQLSRLTNSEEAGWNSKSYWVERGLGRLSKPILQRWTKNSLASNVRPKPRTTSFCFGRKMSDQREATREGSENFLNAKLFMDETPLPGAGKFLGYEIPLAAESNGQLKIDLLGHGNDAGAAFISIVELKKAGNQKDSPLLALTEAICYAIQVIRCKEALLKDAALREKGITAAHFQNIRLILAAPKEYWEYWGGKNSENQLREIVDSVSSAVSTEVGQAHKFSLQPFTECAEEMTKFCAMHKGGSSVIAAAG